MPITLDWKAPFTTSCLHAADGLARGLAIIDPVLAQAIAGPAAGLKMAVDTSGAPPGRLWRNLLGLSGTSEISRHIAETALIKTTGRSQHFDAVASRLGAAISALQAAVRIAIPKLLEELALRERPLREQWEARGPGLVWNIASLTEPGLLPERADVLLVRPAFGGSGAAHLQSNSVRTEAVLANPHADLPEVVRLAWLLAQLDLDLPRHSEEIQADRLPHVARLAMLPVILRAAEAVELVHYSPELIGRAVVQALASIDFAAGPVDPVVPEVETAPWGRRERLSRSAYFALERLVLEGETTVGRPDRFTLLQGLEGTAEVEHGGVVWTVGRGQTWLLPAAIGPCAIRPRGRATVLVCVVP